MEKKQSKKIWLFIMGALILVELIVTIMTASKAKFILDISKLIPLVFVTLYGFWLYKKPHGNMLKYAILILAASEILNAVQCIRMGWDNMYLHTVRVFVAAILVYVAGRLNRIEQNKYLLPFAAIVNLVSVCAIVSKLHTSLTLLYKLTWFSGVLTIITLMIAYFIRYKEHKEAGLADAPKAK